MSNTLDMTRGFYRRIYSGLRLGKRINSVSVDAALLFWHLLVTADDFGNLNGDPEICRIEAAPRRREWTDEKIAGYLQELASTTPPLIQFYADKEDRYVHISDFEQRQPANKNGRRIRRHPESPFGESGGILGNPGESGCEFFPPDHHQTTTTTRSSPCPPPPPAKPGGGGIAALLARMGITEKLISHTLAIKPNLSSSTALSHWYAVWTDAKADRKPAVLAYRLGNGDVPKKITAKMICEAVASDVVHSADGLDLRAGKLTQNAAGLYLDGKLIIPTDKLTETEYA